MKNYFVFYFLLMNSKFELQMSSLIFLRLSCAFMNATRVGILSEPMTNTSISGAFFIHRNQSDVSSKNFWNRVVRFTMWISYYCWSKASDWRKLTTYIKLHHFHVEYEWDDWWKFGMFNSIICIVQWWISSVFPLWNMLEFFYRQAAQNQ